MKTYVKVFLIIGLCLFVSGLVIGGIGFSMGARGIAFDSDFKMFFMDKDNDYIKKTAQTGEFSSIEADIDLGDIRILTSDKFEAEYIYSSYSGEPEIYVEDSVLKIKWRNSRKISFGMNFQSPKITVYLPGDTELNDVNINNNLGAVTVDGLKNIKNIAVSASLGGVNLLNLKSESLTADVASGNLKADGLESEDLYLTCNLGSLKAENLITEGNTKITNRMGNTEIGGELKGRINVDADLGSVKITTNLHQLDYNSKIDVDLGTFKLNGEKKHNQWSSTVRDSDYELNVHVKSGNLDIEYKD